GLRASYKDRRPKTKVQSSKHKGLSRPFFIRVPRAGSQRSSLIALAQLTARATTLKGLFIGAQSGASIHGQHTFDLSMRSRNHVYADQLSDSARCCRT